jgi:DNA-binding PadR family transcriptional regulator
MFSRTTRADKEARVLRELTEPMGAVRLGAVTKLSPGSLYPILMDLEQRGVITSRWEEGAHPRRRLYERAPTLPAPGRAEGRDA